MAVLVCGNLLICVLGCGFCCCLCAESSSPISAGQQTFQQASKHSADQQAFQQASKHASKVSK